MEFHSQFGTRIILGLLVVLGFTLLRVRRFRRFKPLVFGLAGLAGATAFFDFGGKHQVWTSGFVNRTDIFHHQLGSKYFPELGYDGIYAASLLAQEQTAPHLPVPSRIRDLDTYKLVRPAAYGPKIEAVRARFSEDRWQSFLADHLDYTENTPPILWERKIRQDHGYNATPAWTFVARLFDSRLRATESTLTALGVLDLVLVGVMFAVLFRAYGCRVACLSLALFGLGYGWRYIYIGCLLRLDWLAALVVGICLLKRERFATAGVCLGYATMVRVFPLLFLLGPALLAVKSWLRGERPRWPFSFAAGFAGIVCVAFVAGSMTGRGVEAWWEFSDHISNYRDTWSGDIVGLDTMFVSGPGFLLATTERRTLQSVRENLARKTTARIAVKSALLGLLGFTMWRAPLAEAAVLGVFAVFLLTPAAAYYWIMVMIVPMRRGTVAALALLLLAAAIHFIYILMPGPEHSAWHFALLSWGYALILSSWLIADLALAIKRRMGS